MPHRRDVLRALAGAGLASLAPLPSRASSDALVGSLEAEMAARRARGETITGDWLLGNMADLDPREKRVATFELVRDVPYRLSRWTGDPDSLFAKGQGDCRHKSAAGHHMFMRQGVPAERIVVMFDWADLPIPRKILDILPETRSFHDTVEIQLGGQTVAVDATWDPALAAAGFPFQPEWDGISSTVSVTQGSVTVLRPGDVPEGQNLYDFLGIRAPILEKTQAFNRAFNGWTDQFRSRS